MSVEDSVSEFEEAYDDPIESAQETFSAEMLEETLELLKPASPEWVTPDTNLAQVIAGMAERNQGCVLVAKDERLVGIFTERDVVRRVVGKVDINTTTVGEVMTEDPEAVSFHDTVAVCAQQDDGRRLSACAAGGHPAQACRCDLDQGYRGVLR